MVADDDRAARELLASVLRTSGYDVETMGDGQEAYDRVGKGGVDVVLLDVVMPRMGGLEACRLIKGLTTQGFIPVLLVTAKSDPASRVEGLKTGADDYVCKPFEEAELLARVQAMLRIRRLYEEMQTARARLERVAVHDDLTGLYNQRYLHSRLSEEFKRAERNHEPLACCLMDVDRLRLHNDAGGRMLGDLILKGTAEVIRRTVREADIVVRYGGDEFMVLLPTTHFAGSVAMAERVWREVLARSWGGSLGQPGSVSFFFNHLGVIEATHKDLNRDAEGDAIEAGAQEIEPLEAEEIPEGQKGARFLTEIKDLDHVAKALKAAGWNIIASEMRYIAKNFTEVAPADRKSVSDFLTALDDHDDVHRVYAAFK